MIRANDNHATSFISERTAEYVLVPVLRKILLEEWHTVTPLFPWITREGGLLSRSLHGYEQFRVIGLYARRPKMHSVDHSIINVKLNRQILIGAQRGIELGIPIIAGCPIATNFWELGNNPNCVWINLEQHSIEDLNLRLEHYNHSIKTPGIPELVFPSEEEVCDYLIKRAELINLEIAMAAFGDIKRASIGHEFPGRFPFFGGYKPVYLLLK